MVRAVFALSCRFSSVDYSKNRFNFCNRSQVPGSPSEMILSNTSFGRYLDERA